MSLEHDKKGMNERKRNILFLICQYLSDMALPAVRDALITDANLPITSFQLCDNVDLDSIYLDYCSYFELKFGKPPKILKRLQQDATNSSASSSSASTTVNRKLATSKRRIFQQIRTNNENTSETPMDNSTLNSTLTVSKLQTDENNQQDTIDEFMEFHLVPPLEKCIHYNAEWKEMAEVVCRDITRKNFDIQWNHIKGLEHIQSVLVETVLMPLQYPHLFVGISKPWKCILLHGPPGTGKTLLSRALCCETRSKVTFFNVCSSTIVSKWRGDSEKYVRVLFDVAKYYAPSVIFIDEFDGLSSKRDAIGEHEASKRFKNEFLTQIDRLDEDTLNVLLLANTNLPWELDPAFLRRFEKKILVGLPEQNDRTNIIKHFLPEQCKITDDEIIELAQMCDGFSGDEIRVACKEVTMTKIRNAIKTAAQGCSSKTNPENQLKCLTASELKEVFKKTKPMSKHLLEKHIKWNKTFGNQL